MSESSSGRPVDNVSARALIDLDAEGRVMFDARRPVLLDHGHHALQVTAGYVDIFVVGTANGRPAGPRQHLFRAGPKEIILDLQAGIERAGVPIQIVAIGSAGAEAQLVSQADLRSTSVIEIWITRLARLIAGESPRWDITEIADGNKLDMTTGERRRGPARSIAWVSVESGTARPMGGDPTIEAGAPPLPLTSGMWFKAGSSGCLARGSTDFPDENRLWPAVDAFHVLFAHVVHGHLAQRDGFEAQRLALRDTIMARQTVDSFDRLSSVVVPRTEAFEAPSVSADPLLAACQMVADSIKSPLPAGSHPIRTQAGFAEIVEIARSARLRVRRTLLRGEWWEEDAGPLVGWYGPQREPVALIRRNNRGYVMIDAKTGVRRRVDRSIAMDLAPGAASFYPVLPARPLSFRDLLSFSIQHSTGNYGRLAFAIVAIGLLSLVAPFVTNILVNSVIPRSELDQLAFCVLALTVTAFAVACVQTVEALAMLKIEGVIDWRLQAAMIDRLLRLPTALFRDYTVGDFVDRSMGIDAARRALTGRALRGLMAGVLCWFSIGLMLFYDLELGLVATALTLIRAVMIGATSAVRLHHETKYFNLQGTISGYVLQLIAGIGKLRVADATARALAVWSRQFVTQKRNLIASQRASNVLAVFEASYPLIATLVIFAAATWMKSELLKNVGGFLAFFAAFGQSMASVGAWAAGISEALSAIPRISRLRPLLSSPAELPDERKSPGELSGNIELSRVTFRYKAGGPPVLENVSLTIAQGEYVAIVGPSGSGKSTLFRLLLGFEKPESGTVFFDGKAIDTLDISAVRRQLGVVLQNGRLGTGSIYDNVCGGVQLPLDQAWEALRLAGLEEDVKALPMGINTAIAEGVNTLSGGQRQRIMIARAISRRPRIVLFDEATSALDNQSQAIVSDSLGNLNVTRIVIAHRLSTVRRADRIVVVVDGKVVQTGSFAELSSTPGVFARFAERQLV